MASLKLRALLLAPAAMLIASSAGAQVNPGESDPAVWLKQVYDLYQRAERDPALEAQANYGLVERRGSRTLAALLKKDADCAVRTKGVCALDWDFVIDGQAYKLSDVRVGPAVVDGDKATVAVSFRNMNSNCRNVYKFVREDGVWKVDDVVAQSGADAAISIAKLLRDYKD